MTIPVGIDLGTTNSAAATVDASGLSSMIYNMEGDLLTPSVVLMEDDEVIVGKEALSATTSEPDRVAQWVKRDMGQTSYNRPIRGHHFPPEVIQACILHKLERSISAMVDGKFETVITVPAYFDETRRAATVAAGEMAGLDVLDIINEPTAAALAFGETLGYLNRRGDVRKELTVLVYDLGGGTFDVTLLRLAPGDIQTLATDGDMQLGGYDWDMRLVDQLAMQFEQKHQVDLRSDPVGFYRLYNAAVEAKHALSARQKTPVRIVHQGMRFETELTRGQMQILTVDLLERTSHTVREVLRAADIKAEDLDRVLLVGGSTRMPMIPEMLEKIGCKTPARNVNPDEAVARGAAIYARFLLEQQRGDKEAEFEVSNVNSHTLGLEGIDTQTGRRVVKTMIARNKRLPTVKTKQFCTKQAGQRSIVLRVLEGESRSPDECTVVGRTVIRDLPEQLPKGHPVRVTFRYETNGLLSVKAIVEGSDHVATLELQRSVGLSHTDIAKWKGLIETDKGLDDFELAVEVQKNVHDSMAFPGFTDDEESGSSSGTVDSQPGESDDFNWDDPDDLFAMAMLEQREEQAKKKPQAAQRQAPAQQKTQQPIQHQRQPQQRQPKQATQQPVRQNAPVQQAATPAPTANQNTPQQQQMPPQQKPQQQTIPNGAISGNEKRPGGKFRAMHPVLFLVGYATSALVGLGLGYLAIVKLFPMLGLPLPW